MAKPRRPQQTAAPAPANPAEAALAPWPSIDKYPTVLGSNLTLTYLSAVFRLAQTGYRREYVDCLDELLERDAGTYCCYSTRILAIAAARIEIEPASCDDSELEEAKKYALEFKQDFERIENLRQSIASLMWAVYYGVTGSEIGWVFEERIKPRCLYWIHSRRIAYPDPNSWNPKIWDLGAVKNWDFLEPTNTGWGVDVYDFPGKFIIHAPQLRGDYPTRDGVGRETAFWQALKLMAARGGGQYIERFAKPWVLGYYNTQGTGMTAPRVADTKDIDACDKAIRALGTGNSACASLPNSIKVELDGPGAHSSTTGKLVHDDFVNLCDSQISRAVLGSSDTVQAGENGSRASTSERRKNQIDINRYDAACLGDTLTRDLAGAWQQLNHADRPHLRPRVVVYVEDRLTPAEKMALAKDGASVGMPIDADKTAADVGLDLVDKDSKDGRVLLPVKPIENLKYLESGTDREPPEPPTPLIQQDSKPGKPGAQEPGKGAPPDPKED